MTIDELKRVDLVELLSRTWEMSFTREGDCFVALSPFSAEKHPSFYVACAADGHWVYCDHSDGSSGSILDLMMRRQANDDFSQACEAARRLALHSGLNASAAPVESATRCEPAMNWEWLLRQLRSNDSASCVSFLTGRGLDPELVSGLIRQGVVTENKIDGSRYCCFAVRDAQGQLQALFNRRIDGPSERDKFVLGHQYPFCVDWSRLATANVVYLCEGIMDTLSILTLFPDACALAVPGATYDLTRLELPAGARLIDAFDADVAGRNAGSRLRRIFSGHKIEQFDLQGTNDVNEYLQKRDGMSKSVGGTGKLTVRDRIDIALSDRPSRELARRYGIHHSRVCDLRNEASAILADAWSARRPGRKPAPHPAEEQLAKDRKLQEMKKQFELLTMRKEWLDLQLEIRNKRDDEAKHDKRKRKKKSPAEIEMILSLIQQHGDRYSAHTATDRLQQLNMTPSDLSRLRHRKRERVVRESAIPETDVAETVGFIIDHPDIGAGRAHLSLIDQERALVSNAFINEARHEVARLTEEHYRKRHEDEKSLEAEFQARQPSLPAYQHLTACYPHHIWAIDFVSIRLFSFQLTLCVVYDVFSQGYLAIRSGTGCDHQLARDSLKEAIANAGSRAGLFMRRDNGKAFITFSFQQLMSEKGIDDKPIPPGHPWLNGSLESNNTSLKTAIRTDVLQRVITEKTCIRTARRARHHAVRVLQQTCDRVRDKLNHQISRCKFGMPPGQVLNDQISPTRDRHKRFIQRKSEERKKRMARLRQTSDRPEKHKRFIEKVRHAFCRYARDLTTDQLFILNESLHRRYQVVEA